MHKHTKASGSRFWDCWLAWHFPLHHLVLHPISMYLCAINTSKCKCSKPGGFSSRAFNRGLQAERNPKYSRGLSSAVLTGEFGIVWLRLACRPRFFLFCLLLALLSLDKDMRVRRKKFNVAADLVCFLLLWPGYLKLGNVWRGLLWLRILKVGGFKSRQLPLVRDPCTDWKVQTKVAFSPLSRQLFPPSHGPTTAERFRPLKSTVFKLNVTLQPCQRFQVIRFSTCHSEWISP